MGLKSEIENQVAGYFQGSYEIIQGRKVPEVGDIQLGRYGTEVELAMMFVDIRESTKITDGFRRQTAAKMYKSFIYGVAKIARANGGEIRSFNGDGVLTAFYGDSKCTNAAKAALQINWFVRDVLRPKLGKYFENNNQLSDIEFNFGAGIDVGKVLVVRAGFRGDNNNDLVWAGNATNYSVKLSSLSKGSNVPIYISKEVYNRLNKSSKIGEDGRNMWEERVWTGFDKSTMYRSDWYWRPA